MNKQQLKELKKIIKNKKGEYIDEENNIYDDKAIFRTLINIYLISWEIRPAYGYDPIFYFFIKDLMFFKKIKEFFYKHKLPLSAKYNIIYNTKLFTENDLKQRKDEDDDHFFGRLYGYPEIWSKKDLADSRNKPFYIIRFIVNDVGIWFFKQFNTISINPEWANKMVDKLKIIGFNYFKVKINFYVPPNHTSKLGTLIFGDCID